MALQAGDDDPFNMKVLKKAAGTRDSPTLVPSCFDARIVGCICEYHLFSFLKLKYVLIYYRRYKKQIIMNLEWVKISIRKKQLETET